MATSAITAKLPESSDVTSELMRSRREAAKKSSVSSTTIAPSKAAPLPTTTNITPGSEASWLTLGRKAWRAGRLAGLTDGAKAYSQGAVMQDIATELVMLRSLVSAMTQVAHERESQLERMRADRDFWRAQYDRELGEFCEFAEAVRAKYVDA